MDDRFISLSRIAFRRMHGLQGASAEPFSSDEPERLFPMARRNRVAGLWAGSMTPFAAESVWQRQACGQMVHSARLTAEAERIWSKLSRSIPDVRIIKGPALAAQAWPQPGLRSFDDVDFRCAKNSLPKLICGLDELGYRPRATHRHQVENLWHFGWGISFQNEAGTLLEFNHRMFPPHYPWPARLTREPTDGWGPQQMDTLPVTAPTPALHLLICCVHAVWHGWERLSWMADIAGLLVRHPDAFTEAQTLARNHSFCRKALSCGCGAAVRIFGPLPGVPSPDAQYSELIDQSIEILTRDTSGVSVKIQRGIHHRLMSSREQQLYTLRRLATPGDPDFMALPLPASFRWLYWLIRPFRYVHHRLFRVRGGVPGCNE